MDTLTDMVKWICWLMAMGMVASVFNAFVDPHVRAVTLEAVGTALFMGTLFFMFGWMIHKWQKRNQR